MSTSGYVDTNGLSMYYEEAGQGRPLVLLHGAFSGSQSSFGAYIPELARGRRVISLEMQGHAHTADIDRPLRVATMAQDVVGALAKLGVEQADFLGYSMGGGIALEIAIRHPQLVRKAVVASAGYNPGSFHPGLLEGMSQLKPEYLVGSPWHDEYARTAPDPEHFPVLVEKIIDLNQNLPELTQAEVSSIQAPVLLVSGDSDVVLEHMVQFFRLLGGGVFGDTPAGLPRCQLAVLPGTSHTMMVDRADMLLPILRRFLDGPELAPPG
ncbi:MAG TPA: alpha/beta hydrolase [Candidatus Dormibacteraeota bacterium]